MSFFGKVGKSLKRFDEKLEEWRVNAEIRRKEEAKRLKVQVEIERERLKLDKIKAERRKLEEKNDEGGFWE